MTNDHTTQYLLAAGITAAALFFLVATVESLIRPGFSIARHAISMLSLGERGWVMVAAFVVSGVLTMLFAAGFWRATGYWAAPVLLGIYGLGLVMAGIFPAPAGLGFPPGTPDDMQPAMNTSAVLHSVAFMLAFGSVIVASFVLAVNFWMAGSTPLALFCALAGVAMPVLVVLGMRSTIATGVAFYMAAMVAWLVVAIVGLRTLLHGANA